MSRAKLSFADAAAEILAREGRPMHASEITQLALKTELIQTKGKTPEATMHAILATALKRRGEASRFVRVRPGIYGLRKWLEREGGPITRVDPGDERQVRIPHYPTYSSLRALLPVLDGEKRSAVTGLKSKIYELTGNPQATVDWSDPDSWITERLSGFEAELATRIWVDSGKTVNPRHMEILSNVVDR